MPDWAYQGGATYGVNMMTEQAKHTPGPWLAEDYEGAGGAEWYVVPHDHKGTIAALTGLEAESNARLIAAAPDLLEALEGARATILQLINHTYSEAEGTDADWVGEIDAAIAKAKGGVE